ncbi:MAG: phosphate ABC transporter permease subunit PstC [Actinomycetota bacterium]
MALGTGMEQLDIGLLQGSPARRRKEALIKNAFLAMASISIVISAAIVFSLFGEALRFVREVDLSALWSAGWFPRRGIYDIKTVFVGTMLVSLIAMLVAAPLGLGAAVYLSEYARPRIRRLLKPVLEILAGIPSVVLGFFALTWISPEVVQRFFPRAASFNMAAAGIAVGILVTPLVASIAEDALRSVPMALREAAYGIGAKKRTTTVSIVIPAAVSGIVAGFIVGISRAVGETMVVAIAAGATGGALFTLDPLQPGQTMTAAMTALATGSDQVKGAANTFQSMFFLGLLLFFMTLVLNVISERYVRRVRARY